MFVPCSSSERSEFRIDVVASKLKTERSARIRFYMSYHLLVLLCLCVRVYVLAIHTPPLITTPRVALTFAASGFVMSYSGPGVGTWPKRTVVKKEPIATSYLTSSN